jgi:putative flippase GtrA
MNLPREVDLKRMLWHKSDRAWAQFLRYVVVAAVGLVVDFGVLVLLTESAGFHYLLAASVSFLLALVLNYLLSIWWVFPKSRFSRRQEFMLFAAIGVLGLVLNDVLIWLLTSRLGIYYVESKAITTVVVFLWNFLARKAVFAIQHPNAEETSP